MTYQGSTYSTAEFDLYNYIQKEIILIISLLCFPSNSSKWQQENILNKKNKHLKKTPVRQSEGSQKSKRRKKEEEEHKTCKKETGPLEIPAMDFQWKVSP